MNKSENSRINWRGNFQDGLWAVREQGEACLHILADGKPACAARWRYAGALCIGAGVELSVCDDRLLVIAYGYAFSGQ